MHRTVGLRGGRVANKCRSTPHKMSVAEPDALTSSPQLCPACEPVGKSLGQVDIETPKREEENTLHPHENVGRFSFGEGPRDAQALAEV